MTPADHRIEQAGGISDERLADLIRLYDNRVDDRVAPTDECVFAALKELQRRRSAPIVRGELRADLASREHHENGDGV